MGLTSYTEKVIDSHSMASSVSSTAFPINDVYGFALEVVTTGSNAIGTLTVEGSVSGTNFKTIEDGEITLVSAGILVRNVDERQHYRYLRLTFTTTAGASGIINAWLNKKV